MRNELEEIESFIKKCQQLPYFKVVSFDSDFYEEETPVEYEYVRITKEYYHENLINSIPLLNNLSYAYGKYLLYYQFLKEKLYTNDVPTDKLTLQDVCKPGKYEILIKKLSELDLVDKTGKNWIYRNRGYITLLNCLFKKIELKGYTRHITQMEKVAICKNSFNIKVSKESMRPSFTQDKCREYDKFISL